MTPKRPPIADLTPEKRQLLRQQNAARSQRGAPDQRNKAMTPKRPPIADLTPEKRQLLRQQNAARSQRYRDAGHRQPPTAEKRKAYAQQNNRHRSRMRELAAQDAKRHMPARADGCWLTIITEATLRNPEFIIINPKGRRTRETLQP